MRSEPCRARRKNEIRNWENGLRRVVAGESTWCYQWIQWLTRKKRERKKLICFYFNFWKQFHLLLRSIRFVRSMNYGVMKNFVAFNVAVFFSYSLFVQWLSRQQCLKQWNRREKKLIIFFSSVFPGPVSSYMGLLHECQLCRVSCVTYTRNIVRGAYSFEWN